MSAAEFAGAAASVLDIVTDLLDRLRRIEGYDRERRETTEAARRFHEARESESPQPFSGTRGLPHE